MNILNKYTKQDIRDLIEEYEQKSKITYDKQPKIDVNNKIIEQWFEYEDIKEVSKLSGKTSTEIINILENNGIL